MRRPRRAEALAVRRRLQLGVATAGMGAALWGLALAAPGTALADNTSAASSNAPRSEDTGRTERETQDADGAQDTDDTVGPDAADDSDDSRDDKPTGRVDSASTDDAPDNDDESETERPDRDNATEQTPAEQPSTTGPEADVDATARAEHDADSVATPLNTTAAPAIPAGTPSLTASWRSPYQRWVARSLASWTEDSLAWIESLQTSDRIRAQLEASFFTVRRTFFNQAPTIDPVQITGALDGPVTGTLNGYDPDGDRIIYVMTRGPKSGSVVINADGTFTYTPAARFDGVDAFRVTAVDIGFHTNLLEPLRPIGSNPVRSLINQGAVRFQFEYTAGADYWTVERRAALQRAADGLILYFRVTRPVALSYGVEGEFDQGEDAGLASAGSDLISEEPGFWRSVVQHKLLTGVDSNGAAVDGEITWNFGYDWGLGDIVGSGEYDFESTAKHELLHSFGFLSGIGEPGDNDDTNRPLMDRFVRTADGRRPIGRNLEWDSVYDVNLLGAGGGLYFGGRHAVAAYGALVPMYTPASWEDGSSLYHTDDYTFSGTGQLLMNARTGTGRSVRVLSAIEIGILRDLGYRMVDVSR